MLDVAVAYNRYKFLGEEFLTWLGFVIEKDQKFIKDFDQDFVGLEVGNRIVFENRSKESDERITIKGDGASLEEGILALTANNKKTNQHEYEKRPGFISVFSYPGRQYNGTG